MRLHAQFSYTHVTVNSMNNVFWRQGWDLGVYFRQHCGERLHEILEFLLASSIDRLWVESKHCE